MSNNKQVKQRVESILSEKHGNRVYSIEDDLVWVSGMNSNCTHVADQMAKTLKNHDILCGLVHHDDADLNGGVQFKFGSQP